MNVRIAMGNSVGLIERLSVRMIYVHSVLFSETDEKCQHG